MSFILIFPHRVYKRIICNMINYSSFSDFRLGGVMRVTDIPVLLRSPWRKAYKRILRPNFNVNCCLTLLN